MANRNASPFALAFLTAVCYAGGWGIGCGVSNQFFNGKANVADEMAAVFVVASTLTYQHEKEKRRNPKP